MSRFPNLALGALLIAAACSTSAASEPAAAATRAPAVATLPPLGASAQTAPVATPSASTTTSASITPAAATTPAATATPAATSAASPTAASGLSALAAKGKTVYETAGEVGCQDCHGPAGKGGTLKNGQTAPDIRGATYQKVSDALRGGVPNMSFIKLTTAELDAVVEYLQYLSTLP